LQAEEKESQKAISVNGSLLATDSRYSEAVTGRAKQLHAMQHKDQRQQPRPQKPGRKLEAESSDDDDRYGKLLLHFQLQTLHSSTTATVGVKSLLDTPPLMLTLSRALSE